MLETRSFLLTLTGGRQLHGLLSLPDEPGPRPTVVVCHGFKGFMEWGFFPHLAGLLTRRGFTVVRFNFSGSGMRPGDELVSNRGAFSHATFSRDLAELQELLEAVGDRVGAGRIDREKLGLLGHSRGGGTALLASAAANRGNRIGALVTWAGVSTFDRLNEEEKAEWRRRGEVPVINARTGQELFLDRSILDDLESRREDLDLIRAAAARRAPWLIVHGDEDETVPVEEAKLLESHAARPGELLVVAGGSHTFGAQHPFTGPTPPLIAALDATQTWLHRHLS